MDPPLGQQHRCNDIDFFILHQATRHKEIAIARLIVPIMKIYGAKKSTAYWRIERLCQIGFLQARILPRVPPIKIIRLTKLGDEFLQTMSPLQYRPPDDPGQYLQHKAAVLNRIALYESRPNASAFKNTASSADQWAVDFLEMCHDLILSEFNEMRREFDGGNTSNPPQTMKRIVGIIKAIVSLL